LSNDVANSAGVKKQSSSLLTINSLSNLEVAVDMFYLATLGNMVESNYNNKVLPKKRGVVNNSDGTLTFPNDDLGGYTKARNRAPYFFLLISGKPLPDVPPTNEPPPSEIQNEDANNEQTEVQDVSEENADSQKKNLDFNPVQLTQIIEPNITVTTISIDGKGVTKAQRKQFTTSMGAAPLVYYNGIHIEYSDISMFKLYHEGILPAIKIIFVDRNGIFRDDGFPVDDAIITIFIHSKSKRLRSIKMDFKITNFKDLAGSFSIQGIVDIPQIYLRKFTSYSKKTSFECLQEIAKECQLGFATNVSDSNDKMTWINTGHQRLQFISEVVNNSYISDNSFLHCYIDYYYNLCYVDLEKEYNRENSEDVQILSTGKKEFTENDDDEEISKLTLSTDKSFKETNMWINKYKITNRSTKTSLNNAYLTRNKVYNSLKKEVLDFGIDSITSNGDKSIILKGKPGDEEFFKENINSIWSGKLEEFGDGEGNAHNNYNYSPTQNSINLNEFNKIEAEVDLPNPNFNIFKTQKIFTSLLKEVPGANQKTLKFKRLDGNWIIRDIEFNFDGNKHYQTLRLIKRELEIDSNDEISEPSSEQNNSQTNNSEQDYTNELSPYDLPPNDPLVNETPNRNDNPTLDTNNFDLDYIVGHSMKDNSGVLRTLIVIDGAAVDEKVGVAFLKMQEAARKDGVKISINSGFRPAFGPNFKGKTSKGKSVNITTQETLRRDKSRWVTSERAKFTNDEDFIFKARSSAYNPQTAPPGASNHGNGIALDLNSGSRVSLKKVLNNKIYEWLVRNSWKFGFVRAVKTEEWHFEYRPDVSQKGPYALFAGGNSNLFYSDLGLDKLSLA
jgi:LAS superfamily LD-carboxypeptidase LdcB